jgi:ribokinase
MSPRHVSVFGPAYLDRVLRVDRPLVDPADGPPLDQSVDGSWKFGENRLIEIVDPAGWRLDIEPPTDWPGPKGSIVLVRPLRDCLTGRRQIRGLSSHDDLGGMGAGFAAALRGRLWSVLGSETDPTSRAISALIAEHEIEHVPVRVGDHPADWTLLITSAGHGDKLPIGFRGCHAAAAMTALDAGIAEPCDACVVAALPNRLAQRVLSASNARARVFAPAMRNMLDRAVPISSFARFVDFLSCNRLEWESLEDREEVAWQVSILAITDGAAGSSVRYTTLGGEARTVHLSAFPRARPPRDTNRAGETFAATLIATLLEAEWNASAGVVDDLLIDRAAKRASAAAALQLDREVFGFPDAADVEHALEQGFVA